MAESRRVQCRNSNGGRESFRLRPTERGARIDTPGALTRTEWSREQLTALRDALTGMLDRRGSAR